MERETVFFPGTVAENIRRGKSGDKNRIELPPVNSSPRKSISKIQKENSKVDRFNATISVPTFTSTSSFSTFSSTSSSPSSSTKKPFTASGFSKSKDFEDSVIELSDLSLRTKYSQAKTQTETHKDKEKITVTVTEEEEEKRVSKAQLQIDTDVSIGRRAVSDYASVCPDVIGACSTMGGVHDSILHLELGYDSVIQINAESNFNKSQNNNKNRKENLYQNYDQSQNMTMNKNKNKNENKNENKDKSNNWNNNNNEEEINRERSFLERSFKPILRFIKRVNDKLRGVQVEADHDVDVEVEVEVEAGRDGRVNETETEEIAPLWDELGPAEMQLIGIARGLIRRPPLLLLDDVASSLSLNSIEKERVERCTSGIYDARVGNETTIVISHKLNVIRHSDMIIVMNEGKIAEQGTHEELLNFNGWYAETWAKQRLSTGDVDSQTEMDGDR